MVRPDVETRKYSSSEDGDEPLDHVERAHEEHHHSREGDPAHPAGHLRGLYVLPPCLLLAGWTCLSGLVVCDMSDPSAR